MCQRLFIGSQRAIDGVRDRYLSVNPLLGDEVGIARHFPKGVQHVYVGYGHCTCGCGFPADEDSSARHVSKVAREDYLTMQRLGESLYPTLRGRKAVFLWLCLAGQEDDFPKQGRSVTLLDLTAEGFRFRAQELLQVVGRTDIGARARASNERTHLTRAAPARNRGPRR